MKASIEISLYPLNTDYKQKIIQFIHRLREANELKVETNGMSTQLFGEYDQMMDLLKGELGEVFEATKAVAVLKIAPGNLTVEELPSELK